MPALQVPGPRFKQGCSGGDTLWQEMHTQGGCVRAAAAATLQLASSTQPSLFLAHTTRPSWVVTGLGSSPSLRDLSQQAPPSACVAPRIAGEGGSEHARGPSAGSRWKQSITSASGALSGTRHVAQA